jgi:hypothetical protein
MATGEATAAVLHVSDTCGTLGHHSIKADSIAGTNLNGSNGDGAWSPCQSIRIYRAALVDMVEEGQACFAPLATVAAEQHFYARQPKPYRIQSTVIPLYDTLLLQSQLQPPGLA